MLMFVPKQAVGQHAAAAAAQVDRIAEAPELLDAVEEEVEPRKTVAVAAGQDGWPNTGQHTLALAGTAQVGTERSLPEGGQFPRGWRKPPSLPAEQTCWQRQTA